jgi:hypothetical protein
MGSRSSKETFIHYPKLAYPVGPFSRFSFARIKKEDGVSMLVWLDLTRELDMTNGGCTTLVWS